MIEAILLAVFAIHLFEIVALFCIGYVSMLDSTISVEIKQTVEDQSSDREDELGKQARELNSSDDDEDDEDNSGSDMKDLDPRSSLDEITGS